MGVVNFSAAQTADVPVHAFFQVGQKGETAPAAHEVGKFLRRAGLEAAQTLRRKRQKPLRFRSGNEEDAVPLPAMPVLEVVVMVRGMLGEHEHASACLLGGRHDLLDGATAIV